MPERWERELRELRRVDPDRDAVLRRIERGPTGDRMLPRRDRVVAGAVAAIVAVGSIALLWQTRPGDRGAVGGASSLPTLDVTFRSNGTIDDGSPPEERGRRVDTSISYGDALEESFTSTTPAAASVDWVAVDDLTALVPAPTAGSRVTIEADGGDPRILLGSPHGWPDFEGFTRIDVLPSAPGDYVLVFEADYPEGIARTARRVHLVEPGVVQLAATEGGGLDTATAAAYVDGRRTDGFLSTSAFLGGDVGTRSELRPPDLDGVRPIRAVAGAPLVLATDATEATAGLFATYDAFDAEERLPIDLRSLAGAIEGPPGSNLLAVEVVWRHGQTGVARDGTEERALFFFPVEIVASPAPTPAPSVEASPSPGPVSADAVVIDIRRSSEGTGDPASIARFNGQERWMCPDGWSIVKPDGTTDRVVFDCGQGAAFVVPPGSPVTVVGDFASVETSAHVTAEPGDLPSDEVPSLEEGSVVTFTFTVTWDDGSEASFWLLLTVGREAPSSGEAEKIVVRIEGLGRSERSRHFPIMTVSFRGETALGCTEAFGWTTVEGDRIDEASGSSGSILPRCSHDPLFVVPPGTAIVVESERGTEVFPTRTTTPLYVGVDGIGVSVRWSDGNGDFLAYVEVRSEAPVSTEIELACDPGDRIPFAPPEGPRVLPGGSAYITGNLSGFVRGDVVEQMTRHGDGGPGGWEGIWQVTRHGAVIATVDFGDLSGVACRGSGIAGV